MIEPRSKSCPPLLSQSQPKKPSQASRLRLRQLLSVIQRDTCRRNMDEMARKSSTRFPGLVDGKWSDIKALRLTEFALRKSTEHRRSCSVKSNGSKEHGSEHARIVRTVSPIEAVLKTVTQTPRHKRAKKVVSPVAGQKVTLGPGSTQLRRGILAVRRNKFQCPASKSSQVTPTKLYTVPEETTHAPGNLYAATSKDFRNRAGNIGERENTHGNQIQTLPRIAFL